VIQSLPARARNAFSKAIMGSDISINIDDKILRATNSITKDISPPNLKIFLDDKQNLIPDSLLRKINPIPKGSRPY
jgi:predicted methyltransferase